MSAETFPGNYFGTFRVDNMKARLVIPDSEILQRMAESYSLVTAHTAVAAYKKKKEIDAAYQGEQPPPKHIIVERGYVLDQAAATVMTRELNKLNFMTDMIDSEGDKEEPKYGKKAATVKRLHGKGQIMHGLNDVIEGTTDLSLGRNNSLSVLGVVQPNCDGNGLSPHDGSLYMMKHFFPPQAREVVESMMPDIIAKRLPYEEILRRVNKVLIAQGKTLTQVTLDSASRKCNEKYVKAARAAGVKALEIPAGDFLPSVASAMGHEHPLHGVLAVGTRGGDPEGKLANLAALALGAPSWYTAYHEDENVLAEQEVRTARNHVFAAIDKIVVCGTFITDCDWLDKPGVRDNGNGTYDTTSLVITHKGVDFIGHTIAA